MQMLCNIFPILSLWLWWPSWTSNRHLVIFDLEVIMLLQCVSIQIDQRFGWLRQKLVFKMAAMVGIFAIFHLHNILLLHCKFQLSSPLWLARICPKQIFTMAAVTDTILTHFDPEVVLFLQSKFRLKSTKGLGRDVENWFSRWWLWWPSWIFYRLSFSYFVSARRPNALHQVSTQLDHSF